jgi:nucleotide-binding universal stress UspA family protein
MTVAVAYSADEYGRAALEFGIAEAKRDGERLIVVNVTRGDALVDPRYAGSTEADEVRERLAAAGLVGDFVQAMSPDVPDRVLALVEEEDPRLLVVGIRRRSPMGKLIMGSVAQRLILDAACPVVAVKPH